MHVTARRRHAPAHRVRANFGTTLLPSQAVLIVALIAGPACRYQLPVHEQEQVGERLLTSSTIDSLEATHRPR
jgi:hypothetical protein